MALEADSRIGRYQIQRRVAHGGMATLYLATDPVLGRPVALKLFQEDVELPDAHDRFAREARAVATLNHPNIVTIYDYGEHESQPFIVMEFIEGETLAAVIRRRAAIPLATKLRWMEELCSAVAYAHGNGVIHRDLKPLNLIVDSSGRLKVLDFGIARMRGTLTSRATARVGTAGYMAPEQIRGGNVDHRSDLFSIGVVCYELLSYVEPFGADTDPAITNRILQDNPAPLTTVTPGLDGDLSDLVSRALAKEPEARFQDAESMRAAVGAIRRRVELLDTNAGLKPYVPDVAIGRMAGEDSPSLGRQRLPHPDAGFRPTPRPEGRADREAIARKRTAHIQESLQLAHQHFEGGRFESARAQCEMVLRLDRAHPDALALLLAIEERLGPIDESPIVAGPEARTQISPATQETVMSTAPGSRDGRPSGPIYGPDPQPIPASSPVPGQSTRSPAAARARVTGPATRVRRRTSIVLGVATMVMAAIGVALWWSRRPPPPPPPAPQVALVLDAIPWGTIKKLTRETGGEVRLPDDDGSTPVSLQLAPGRYSVSIEGPPPGFELRAATIEVTAAGSQTFIVQDFKTMTADKYFERYSGAAGRPDGAAGVGK